MSEELKINNIPLFNIGEEAEIENKLLFHLDEFTNEIMKTMTRDKEIIILKKVIEQQQKEIEVLTLDLEEMTKSNNHKKENWVHKNILNSYISKDKIRELLEEYRCTGYYEVEHVLKELLEEN